LPLALILFFQFLEGLVGELFFACGGFELFLQFDDHVLAFLEFSPELLLLWVGQVGDHLVKIVHCLNTGQSIIQYRIRHPTLTFKMLKNNH
jgi:hypothetical protein